MGMTPFRTRRQVAQNGREIKDFDLVEYQGRQGYVLVVTNNFARNCKNPRTMVTINWGDGTIAIVDAKHVRVLDQVEA